MSQGSKGHDFSCKHKNHDLLTLALSKITIQRNHTESKTNVLSA